MFIYILSPPFSLPFPRNFFPQTESLFTGYNYAGTNASKIRPCLHCDKKKKEFGICKKFENFVIVSSRLEPCLHLWPEMLII